MRKPGYINISYVCAPARLKWTQSRRILYVKWNPVCTRKLCKTSFQVFSLPINYARIALSWNIQVELSRFKRIRPSEIVTNLTRFQIYIYCIYSFYFGLQYHSHRDKYSSIPHHLYSLNKFAVPEVDNGLYTTSMKSKFHSLNYRLTLAWLGSSGANTSSNVSLDILI